MDVKQMKKLMRIMKYIQADDPSFSQPASSASQHAASQHPFDSQSILHRDNELYAAESVWDQAEILLTQNARKVHPTSSSSSSSQRAPSQSQAGNRKRAHHDDDG
jgi:hypothetical protein